MTKRRRSTSSSVNRSAGGSTSTSITSENTLSTSTRSARRNSVETRRTLPARGSSMRASLVPRRTGLTTSNSRIGTTLYNSEFRLSWDNDISFHVAQNAIRLRKFRRQSQASVARAMGTSQSAVARIEGEDENITLRTLKRLVEALSGRIRFAIEPAEANLPRWPDWWHMVAAGISASQPYVFRGAAEKIDVSGHHIAAGWTANNLPDAGTSGSVLEIAEA